MQLIDDLLKVAADQGLQDLKQPRVASRALQGRVDPGGPLGVAEDAAQRRVVRQAEVEIAIAPASPVRHGLGENAVEGFRQRRHFAFIEDAGDDRIAVAVEL